MTDFRKWGFFTPTTSSVTPHFENKFLIFLLDIFHCNPGLSFFLLDLAPDIVYEKATAAGFWYLVRFKLNLLKLSCCYSILRLATNEERFK